MTEIEELRKRIELLEVANKWLIEQLKIMAKRINSMYNTGRE